MIGSFATLPDAHSSPSRPLPIPDIPAPACCCCCENRAENESYGLPSQRQPCPPPPGSIYGQIEGILRPLSCSYIYIFRSERVRECPGSGQICNRGCWLCAACRTCRREKNQALVSTSASDLNLLLTTARRGRARHISTYVDVDVWPVHLSLKVSVQPT